MVDFEKGKAGVAHISIDAAQVFADELAKKSSYNDGEIKYIEEYLQGLAESFDRWEIPDFERAYKLIVNWQANEYGLDTDITVNALVPDDERKYDGIAHVNFNLNVVLEAENKANAFMKEVYDGVKAVVKTELTRASREDRSTDAYELKLDHFARKADALLSEKDRTVATSLFDILSSERAINSLNNLVTVNLWSAKLKDEFMGIKNEYEENKPSHLRRDRKKYESNAYRAIPTIYDHEPSEVKKMLYRSNMEKDFKALEKEVKKDPTVTEVVNYHIAHDRFYQIQKALNEGNKEKLAKFFVEDNALFLSVYRYIQYQEMALRRKIGKKAKGRYYKALQEIQKEEKLAYEVINENRNKPAEKDRYNVYVNACPNGSNVDKAADIVSFFARIGSAAALEYIAEHFGVVNAAKKSTAEELYRALSSTGVDVVMEPAKTCLDHPTIDKKKR